MNGQAIGRRLGLAVAAVVGGLAGCAVPMEFILADENERKMRSVFSGWNARPKRARDASETRYRAASTPPPRVFTSDSSTPPASSAAVTPRLSSAGILPTKCTSKIFAPINTSTSASACLR